MHCVHTAPRTAYCTTYNVCVQMMQLSFSPMPLNCLTAQLDLALVQVGVVAGVPGHQRQQGPQPTVDMEVPVADVEGMLGWMPVAAPSLTYTSGAALPLRS